MNNPFAEIIIKGINAGKTALELNAELEAAGADFRIDFSRSGDGWTEQEMKDGFRPAENEPQEVKHLYDYMRVDPAKANTEETVWTPEGHYQITFDEGGYPKKAVKIHG